MPDTVHGIAGEDAEFRSHAYGMPDVLQRSGQSGRPRPGNDLAGIEWRGLGSALAISHRSEFEVRASEVRLMTADRGGGPLNPAQGVLRLDVLAGLTAAAVVVPKALAYATIAGLPVQVGLYTASVPMVVYALLGTSRPLSVSTTTTIAILTGAELGRVAPGGGADLFTASATLAVLVGVLLLLASALRLGFVANFISDPVLTGFKSGIGLVIVVDQIPKLLGIHIDKAGFFRDLISIASHLPATSVVTLVLALLMLALIFLVERFAASRTRAARRDRSRHRSVRAARTGPGRSGCHRRSPGRRAATRPAETRDHVGDVAGGRRNRLDEFHGGHCRGAGVCGAR